MLVKAHLMFDGQAEEALAFYSGILDGKVENLMRYGDVKAYPGIDPIKDKDRVINACLKFGDNVINICDIPSNEKLTMGDNIMMDIVSHDGNEIKQIFASLSQGGIITMPLAPTFWSPNYGMITDKFGIHWNIMQMQ